MPDFSPTVGANRFVNFSAYTSGDGIINSSASANTKGSWEAIATTSFDLDGLLVNFSPSTLSVRDFLCDLSIGGSGSEQIILSNILYSSNTLYDFAHYWFPLHIPAGSVIRARTQSSTGSSAHELFFHGFGQSFDGYPACTRVETLGANTADSGGTSIDPGGSTGVFGTWQQITASTSFHYRYLIVALGNQANAARTTMVGDSDIGIGASSSEVILIPGLRWGAHSTSDTVLPHTYGPFPVSIPAGSRLSARSINYSTNATPARLIDFVLYGIG